jgi:hypothetical protein
MKSIGKVWFNDSFSHLKLHVFPFMVVLDVPGDHSDTVYSTVLFQQNSKKSTFELHSTLLIYDNDIIPACFDLYLLKPRKRNDSSCLNPHGIREPHCFNSFRKIQIFLSNIDKL